MARKKSQRSFGILVAVTAAVWLAPVATSAQVDASVVEDYLQVRPSLKCFSLRFTSKP